MARDDSQHLECQLVALDAWPRMAKRYYVYSSVDDLSDSNIKTPPLSCHNYDTIIGSVLMSKKHTKVNNDKKVNIRSRNFGMHNNQGNSGAAVISVAARFIAYNYLTMSSCCCC